MPLLIQFSVIVTRLGVKNGRERINNGGTNCDQHGGSSYCCKCCDYRFMPRIKYCVIVFEGSVIVFLFNYINNIYLI